MQANQLVGRCRICPQPNATWRTKAANQSTHTMAASTSPEILGMTQSLQSRFGRLNDSGNFVPGNCFFRPMDGFFYHHIAMQFRAEELSCQACKRRVKDGMHAISRYVRFRETIRAAVIATCTAWPLPKLACGCFSSVNERVHW